MFRSVKEMFSFAGLRPHDGRNTYLGDQQRHQQRPRCTHNLLPVNSNSTAVPDSGAVHHQHRHHDLLHDSHLLPPLEHHGLHPVCHAPLQPRARKTGQCAAVPQ